MIKITPKNKDATTIDYDGGKPGIVIVFWGQDGGCSYEHHVFTSDWSEVGRILHNNEGATYEILTLEQYVTKPYVTVEVVEG
jgi:hypothetical protein